MILLVSTCKEKLHEREFVEPYMSYLEKTVDVVAIHYTKLKIDDVAKADCIVICGTGLMDNGYLEHIERFSWIRDANKSIMGVCSGAQIIAAVFGGKIVPDKLIGMVSVRGTLFDRREFPAYVLHQNGFETPENFDTLAASGKSIQAIKHKTRPIYGVAFHPEVRNMWVLEKFLGVNT